jgi:hypothetical protein
VSGGPSPAGAAQTIALLDKVAECEIEICKLEPRIAADTKRLAEVTEERNRATRELRTLLERMDVDTPGNYGWGSRFAELLGELVRQVRSEKR